VSVDNPTTPTLAALRRARARQEAAVRWLRPLSLVVALLVIARAFRGTPAPSGHGAGLGVSVALVAIAAGAAGVLATYRVPGRTQLACCALFLAGSAALFWLQPGGAGLFGALVAVGVMTRWLPPRLSVLPVAATLAVIAASAVADPARHPVSAVLLSEIGLAAIYGVGLLTRRIGAGNIQTERLLMELEQTRGAEVRAAALAERQRLAREMHDVLAHSLSGLALQLEGARLLADTDPADPRLGGLLERAHDLARTGVQEARWAIGMLRDDELPGPERLAALVADFGQDSGVASRFTVTGEERPLVAGTRLALLRVTQEALTNVRKHAKAERVEVVLGYRPDGVELTIEDFAGPGGPDTPDTPGAGGLGGAGGPPSGYGLTGMAERAELLGGTLRAARTGGGFRVTMWVPA
jgi:signal transduction histidine kinase